MSQFILSALGPDRPGIVDQLTEALCRHHANIADSRMVNLRGQFAIVMLVDAPESQTKTLQEQLPAAAAKIGLQLTITQPSPQGAALAGGAGGGIPYRIAIYAMDQAGLVHRYTRKLHEHEANIEELTTRLEHAPHSGTPLFSMQMTITLRPGTRLKPLRDDLEALSDELNCDLDIQPA